MTEGRTSNLTKSITTGPNVTSPSDQTQPPPPARCSGNFCRLLPAAILHAVDSRAAEPCAKFPHHLHSRALSVAPTHDIRRDPKSIQYLSHLWAIERERSLVWFSCLPGVFCPDRRGRCYFVNWLRIARAQTRTCVLVCFSFFKSTRLESQWVSANH
ncbi:hypothetical protein DFH06DRAFT_1134148 [Mycena polygramma]|nr:hypothetical protein DFH06DRAFT_1134148 [Mycena polygramma]